MIAWQAFGIEVPEEYPIRIVNEIDHVEKILMMSKTRGEIVEGLLWGALKSTRAFEDDSTAALDEALGVVIHIKEDEIVLRWYANGEDEAAREVLRRLQPQAL